MSDGLSWYIVVLVVANLLAMAWLIWWSGKGSAQAHPEGETMGHTWDGDLQEYNNPLPRWWLWLFYGTIIFAFLYLAVFPGLGKFSGFFGWTQENQYDKEVAAAEAKYGPIFDQYLKQDLAAVMQDPQALEMGGRIYANYCAMCHGADAHGARGFPNLADGDWLYGGAPQAIKTTIMHGRNGIMPGFEAALQPQGVEEVTEYLLSLSGREHDAAKAEAGKAKYALCAGCHMPDGSGNQALGAPSLKDDVWLYGASRGAIAESIGQGRNGVMPAFADFLGEAKVHLVAAYVASLSAGK